MKKHLALVIASLLSSFCYAQIQVSSEVPSSIFIVEINNEEYTLSEGEELKVDSTKVTVKLADYRNFKSESISFDYPSGFAFVEEQNVEFIVRKFTGSHGGIMYFEMNDDTELDAFVRQVAGQFGAINTQVDNLEMTIGDKKLTGKRINVSVLDRVILIDFLEIELADSKSRFISFQKTKAGDGSFSDESTKAFEMVDKTIKYY